MKTKIVFFKDRRQEGEAAYQTMKINTKYGKEYESGEVSNDR